MINPQQIKERKQRLNCRLKYLIDDEEMYGEDNADRIEDIKRDFTRLFRHEKRTYANDLVQPGDSRFKTLYKKQWLEQEKEKEMAELKAKSIKAEQDKFYKDNLHEGRDKVTNALNLEDKIRNG